MEELSAIFQRWLKVGRLWQRRRGERFDVLELLIGEDPGEELTGRSGVAAFRNTAADAPAVNSTTPQSEGPGEGGRLGASQSDGAGRARQQA
ncbi:hypothetical protein [Dactylosporangium sp. NPDC051484]|uniref:hypothetical protein n=1 Tax=Dactylosporangium sp. NPDC051484 TaxID=3154942 RepID=UPI00344C1469